MPGTVQIHPFKSSSQDDTTGSVVPSTLVVKRITEGRLNKRSGDGQATITCRANRSAFRRVVKELLQHPGKQQLTCAFWFFLHYKGGWIFP